MTTTKTTHSIRNEIQQAVNEAIAIWEESRADCRRFAGAITDGVLDPGTATDIVHAAMEEVIAPLGFSYLDCTDGVDCWPHSAAPVEVTFNWNLLTVGYNKSFGYTDTIEQAWDHVKSYEEREVLALLAAADDDTIKLALAYWNMLEGSFLSALEEADERFTGCYTLKEFVEARLEERDDIPEDIPVDIDQMIYDIHCGGEAFESDGYVFWSF